jgi:hypothetical protein
MPRGVPLTPLQVEIIARVHEETGNASEAARQAGCVPSAAVACLDAMKNERRRKLHTRACERGLREGRRHMTAASRLLAGILSMETPGALVMDPKDIAAIANALTSTTKVRLDLAATLRKNALGRLTREKTRAEVAILRHRLEQSPVDDRVVMTYEARERLAAELSRFVGRPLGLGPVDQDVRGTGR